MPHYEKGSYRAKVTSQRFGQTPTGTPYFAIEFEPTQSLGANGFPDTVHRREVTLYMSEKAAPYSIENLRRLGWDGTNFIDLEPTSDSHHSLAGTEIDVVCDYNDNGYEDWNLTAPGSAPKSSDKAVASKLDKLFGKALKSSGAKPKSKPKKEPVAAGATPSPPDDDSELPF